MLLRRLLIACILLVAILVGGVVYKQFTPKPPTNKPIPNLIHTPEYALLADIASWYPLASWSAPQIASAQTFYAKLSGQVISATITSATPLLHHFEDSAALGKKGFYPDNNLLADGPGASSWGYVKINGRIRQVIVFSYKTQPTSSNPNEPVQFNCPCKMNVSVFVSYSF